jgi:hypothetical protein
MLFFRVELFLALQHISWMTQIQRLNDQSIKPDPDQCHSAEHEGGVSNKDSVITGRSSMDNYPSAAILPIYLGAWLVTTGSSAADLV